MADISMNNQMAHSNTETPPPPVGLLMDSATSYNSRTSIAEKTSKIGAATVSWSILFLSRMVRGRKYIVR